MANHPGRPDRYVPSPAAAILLQADWRILGAFLRTGTGEWIHPRRLHWFLAFLVLAASAVHPLVWHLCGVALTGWDVLAWTGFTLAVFLVARPMAKETARRAYQEKEIRPSGFVGWPRVLDFRRYATAGGIEARRMWKQATVWTEPVLGLLVAAGVALLSPSLGGYLALSALLLRATATRIVKEERKERIRLQDSMFEAARLQRLLEEIEGRGMIGEPDGTAGPA